MKSCSSKTCTQINPQSSECFYARKENSDGLMGACKNCIGKGRKGFYSRQREKILAYKKTPHALEIDRKSKKRNRAKIQTRINKKRKSDIQFAISDTLRARFFCALTRGFKGGGAIRDLGCSIAELLIHLEKQFKPGMTWENRGHAGWHIDHIQPLSSFDLSNPAQVKIACNYKNLQPLWAVDNFSKGAKI